MEWPILTAIAAFAVAAIFVGALFLKIGEPLGYIPQCSDCRFFLKGPASLVQTEGAAYLIRGAMLTPSSILAEYGWAYDGAGRPLKPGQSIYCEKGIFVRVVDGLAQASCNNFSAPIQLAYSSYTPIIFPQPPAPSCNTSATLTWPPTKTMAFCFQNSTTFSGWRAHYFVLDYPPAVSWTVTLKDKAGNTVTVTTGFSYSYSGGWWYPYYCVGVSENGAVLWIFRTYRSACFGGPPTVTVTSNAVTVTGPNPTIQWLNPAVFSLPTPLAKGYLNVTFSASGSNIDLRYASVDVVSS